jgi:hypothetical protein
MLDQLDAATLPARAAAWQAAGIDSRNVRALAGASDPEVSDGVRSALLAEIAAEFDLGFATLQDARSVRALDIVRAMGEGEDVGTQIYGLSNGFTDEWTGKLKAFFTRRKSRE